MRSRVWLPMLLVMVSGFGRAADRSPNIVLVMADDQGWGDMAYAGHPRVVTPNFDKAAAEGIRFDRFYAAAPVCSPTRGSVMTGRHPNRYGVFKWGYPLRPQELSIAKILKGHGYQTAHFGKWHLGSVRNGSPVSPGAHGFDAWLSAPNFFDNDPILSREGKAVQMLGESSIVTAEAAIDWMRQVGANEQPFFAVVWFGSPHSPHRAVTGDREPYADLPARDQNFLGEVTGMDRAYGMLREELRRQGIEKNTILWYCSDNGALPGVGSTGGFRGNKGKVYEGGLLVPAILEWPGTLSGARSVQTRCSTCDILPTVVDLAGLTLPEELPRLDGISLCSVLEEQNDAMQRPSGMGFWDYTVGGLSTPSAQWMGDLLKAQQEGGDLQPDLPSQNAADLPSPAWGKDQFPGHSAWISGNWKLHRIEQRPSAGGQASKKQKQQPDVVPQLRWELYDLATDREESENVLESHPEVAARLQQELQQWLGSVVDSFNGSDY